MSNDLTAFLSLVSALDGQGAHIVPPADAEDMRNGAARIPGEVTDARRLGQTVKFVQTGAREDWYWEMPDGAKIRHG